MTVLTETEIHTTYTEAEDLANLVQEAVEACEALSERAGEAWDVQIALDAHAEIKGWSLTADRAAARARFLAQQTIKQACRGGQLRTSPDLHDRMMAANAAAGAVQVSMYLAEAWESVTAMREGDSYFN